MCLFNASEVARIRLSLQNVLTVDLINHNPSCLRLGLQESAEKRQTTKTKRENWGADKSSAEHWCKKVMQN